VNADRQRWLDFPFTREESILANTKIVITGTCIALQVYMYCTVGLLMSVWHCMVSHKFIH